MGLVGKGRRGCYGQVQGEGEGRGQVGGPGEAAVMDRCRVEGWAVNWWVQGEEAVMERCRVKRSDGE